MPVKVNLALNTSTSNIITIVYRREGKYERGVWVEDDSTPETTKAFASVQQPNKTVLERLPEGQRFEEVKLFICNKLVRGGSEDGERTGDTIIFNNKYYEVIKAGDHSQYGHWKAVGVIRAQ